MNDHRRALILAAEAIDFGLPDDDRATLAVHVRTCADCRHGADRLRAQALVLRDRPRALPPFTMREHVAATWTAEAPRIDAGGTLRMLLLGAAVLLAAFGLAVLGAGARQPIDALVPSAVPASPPAAPTLPTVGSVSVMHVPAGEIVDTRECSVVVESGCATDVLAAFDSVWTTTTDSIARIDPASSTVATYIAVDGIPLRMVEAGGAIWVTVGGPGTIVRIDPASNEVTASVEVGDLPAGVALGAGSLWVADQVSRSLVRVDLATAMVTSSIDLPVAPWDVAADDRAVWITDRSGQTLVQVDAAENEVVATRPVPGGHPNNAWSYGDGVTVLGDRVLIASGQQIATFDPTNETFSVAIAPEFSHVVAESGRLWLVSSATRSLQQRDPVTLATVASQRVQVSPPRGAADWDASITFDGDSLWIRSYPEDLLIRVSVETP